MPYYTGQLFADGISASETVWYEDTELVCFGMGLPLDQKLTILTLKVSRTPGNLINHIRRIYFCYRYGLREPLYAALLDWLIILNGRGRELSLRLLHGCQSQLDPAEILIFRNRMDNAQALAGNRYSLFTGGLIGCSKLVEIGQAEGKQDDFMQLAQDFIEFSQLDEAIAVLERGLDLQPERRDMQEALLELYRATGELERFGTRFRILQQAGIALSDGWRHLNESLHGENHG